MPKIVYVFAGRVADTCVDPESLMKEAVELLWASPRKVFNSYQAERLGMNTITCTPLIIKKLSLQNKDLEEYSLETIQMF